MCTALHHLDSIDGKYIKYYRNLYMACVRLGKLHAFSRYNSNFQCDTNKKKTTTKME